jgi:Sulfatase
VLIWVDCARIETSRKTAMRTALTALLLVAATQAFAQRPPKPNVVFILGDNVGYGDLGSYGGGELRGAPTPRLDQLAREGLRLF